MALFPIIFRPSKPINHEGNVYRRLTFNRPIGLAEIIVSELYFDPVEQMSVVAASLAGVPVGVVYRMSIEDQTKLAIAIAPILDLAPAVPATVA